MKKQKFIFNKIKDFVLSHKVITGIIIFVIILILSFAIKSFKNDQVSYITEKVKLDKITTTVTGTGQVEATSTITLGSKASGIVTYVGVKTGDMVRKGQLLASVESKDERIALENAQISLRKLRNTNSLDLIKTENSLKESYDSGWNKASSYITDTTKLLDDMKDIFGSDGYLGYRNIAQVSGSGREKINDAESSYYKADKSVEELSELYKTLSRSDSNDKIKDLIKKAHESSLLVATTTKDIEDALNYAGKSLDDEDNTNFTSARTNVTSWITTANNYTNSLLSSYNSIVESTESYDNTISGGDELDIRSAELSVEQKQDAYNDCFVYAPFDGIIATFTAKVGENASSGVGTIITKQKIVKVSLNEVDIAFVKMGQKVSVTFDAINDLILSGEVSEIDSVGTVSSGVVSYNIKIVLNNDDERVKAGMSANIEIVTANKDNVLTLPSSAIKTRVNSSFVEVLDADKKSVRREIKIGISNDINTEIISGLNEGEEVIIKTSSSNTSKNNNSKISGGGPAMGGMMH